MRYIDLTKLAPQITQEWKAKAAKATQDVLGAAPTDRPSIINRNSDIWSEIKPIFEGVFHSKCWYSESENPGCSKDMDHFRPKNEVAESPEHPGYWWLAFDWKNYRFCCQFCNRLKADPSTKIIGGKSTYFPLLNPAARVSDPTALPNAHERPKLLDPTVPTDPILLSFEPDGRAVSRYTAANAPEAFDRADTSVSVYNLNYYTFRQHRAKLCCEIERLIDRGNECVEDDRFTVRKNEHKAFAGVIEHLLKKADESAPYSAAAREYIRKFRYLVWVENFVILNF